MPRVDFLLCKEMGVGWFWKSWWFSGCIWFVDLVVY